MAEGGWISKYGVPSLIISVAALALQQQQQTSDRLLANTQSGWVFYAGARTNLIYGDEVDRELYTLEVIGLAFPNIYCLVREDLFKRASSLQAVDAAADGRPLIDNTDIVTLQENIVSRDTPATAQLPATFLQAWIAQFAPPRPRACGPLGDSTLVASNDAPAAEEAAPPPPPPPPPPAATDTRGSEASQPMRTTTTTTTGRDRGAGAVTAPAEVAVPSLTAAPQLMRVFFHVRADSPYGADITATAREALAPYNYRVMRQVVRVGRNFPARAEIRYNGSEEGRVAAEQLASYLNAQYAPHGITFALNGEGSWTSRLPAENLEVWITNPQ